MNVKSFNSLTNSDKEDFFLWLSEQSNNDPAYENMWNVDWKDDPKTLPYILINTDKFSDKNGDYHIVYDNKTIAACGGIYRASFNSYIALAGIRTWIHKNYRNKLIARNILLPVHKKWAKRNKCKQIALSFNDYNKNLIVSWKRVRAGENKSLRVSRQPKHMFYDNFNEVEFPVIIQYTKQWIIYEKLDKDWEFNWSIIKCK